MTAKETAQELVKSYLAIQESISWTEDKKVINDLEEWYKSNTEAEKYWLILAQKSAFIEAKNTLQLLVDTHKMLSLKDLQDKVIYDKVIHYWKDVKDELKAILNNA